MGTRGAYGFFIDGQTKVSYNHYDSYPSALGENMLTFARTMDIEDARKKARALRAVPEEDVPTAQDIEEAENRGSVDRSVGGLQGSRETWYQLLRKHQGLPKEMLESGVYIDDINFLQDSLFCEWAYVINLDDCVLEVYRGFQREPHQDGRYAGPPSANQRNYYPVALVKVFPFDRLPKEGTLESIVEESEIEELAREGASP